MTPCLRHDGANHISNGQQHHTKHGQDIGQGFLGWILGHEWDLLLGRWRGHDGNIRQANYGQMGKGVRG